MKNTAFILIGIAIIAAAVFWYVTSSPQSSTSTDQSQQESWLKSVELTLTDKELSPNVVTVTQGDQVTFKVMSDESGEFHISGYEIVEKMEKGKLLEFSFQANTAGQFNLELHPAVTSSDDHHDESTTDEGHDEVGADIEIGTFVVNPI